MNVVAPVNADLAVTAATSVDIDGLSGVTATVTGLPDDATATLTASANGNEAFHPDGVPADVCSSETSTVWTCTVTPDLTSFTFAVNAQQGRDLTFVIEPDPPLTDTQQGNNVFHLSLGG